MPSKLENISNGLLVWSLKLKKMEDCLNEIFQDPILKIHSFSISLKVFFLSFEVLFQTYLSILPSRKRLSQFINDIKYIEAFTAYSFDKLLVEFSLIFLEILQNCKNLNSILNLEEIIPSLIGIWLIYQKFHLLRFVIECSLEDLKNFLESNNKNSFSNKKTVFEAIEKIKIEKTFIFSEIWNKFYLKNLQQLLETGI